MQSPPLRALCALISCAGFARAAPAQVTLVVPREHEASEAPALAELAGLTQPFRQQVLVRGEEFAAVRGREITALWVRRDVQLPVPLRGGKAQLVVTLSDRARHPSEVVPVFAANRGPQPVEVFRGVVEVPSAPPPTAGQSAAWASPTAVEIVFARPFRYGEGSVCLEIEGRPLPGDRSLGWPVDHALWSHDGTMAMAGRSCDPRLHAMAVWTTLAPGSTVTMFATGPVQTTGICLIGRELTSPLDLAAQGAPGCLVHVDPFAVHPFLFPRVKGDEFTRVQVPLPLPAMGCLLGARFAIQWLQAPSTGNRARFATTHVQVLQLASAMPAFPGAMVRSGAPSDAGFPEQGAVQLQQMPVLRFVLRP